LPVLGGFYSRVAFPVVLNAERVAETYHEYKKRGSAKNLTGVGQKITEKLPVARFGEGEMLP